MIPLNGKHTRAALAAVCMAVFPVVVSAQTAITKESPEFPREALKAGVDSGEVKVKVTIDAAGNVVDVQIVEAKPPRIFDRAVRTAMSKWKFNPGEDKRTYETVVEFKR